MFGIARSNSPPPLENLEDIFNNVPVFVNALIVFPLHNPVGFWRNDNFNTVFDSFIHCVIRIKCLISRQGFVFNTFGQFISF